MIQKINTLIVLVSIAVTVEYVTLCPGESQSSPKVSFSPVDLTFSNCSFWLSFHALSISGNQTGYGVCSTYFHYSYAGSINAKILIAW